MNASETDDTAEHGRWVREEPRVTRVFADVDVLVAGGGPAGVCAAVAAARNGASVMLVERHGFLGGMWTAGMVLTLAGYNSWLRPYQRCVAGVPGEWLSRALKDGGAEDNASFVLNSDPEVMKIVADELLAEAGVDFLFHTWLGDPIVQNDTVRGAFVETVEDRFAILANTTIDCTGDGLMLSRAAAHMVSAPALQPMTMPFRLLLANDGVGTDHLDLATLDLGPEPELLGGEKLMLHSSRRADVSYDADTMRSARLAGDLPSYGGPWFGGLDKRVLWVNTTRIAGDATKIRDLTRAEVTGRADSQRLMEYLRDAAPELAGAELVDTSTQIGVRETRRLVGEFCLRGSDIRNSRRFRDGIAIGCWPLDVHPADDGVGKHSMYVPAPYEIPMATLLPTTLNGILAAGRCISVDREALGSTRVGATSGAIGEAAGTLAALAAGTRRIPRDVDPTEVRARLKQGGALIDVDQLSGEGLDAVLSRSNGSS